MKSLIALASLLLLAPGPGHAGKTHKAAEPIAFHTSVKLTVDANGKVQAAEAPAKLPKAMRDFIESQARDWRFTSPVVNGTHVGGVTYALLGACAIPTERGSYWISVDYKGNGPRSAGSDSGWVQPPRYPSDAWRRRHEAEMVLDLTIGSDGRASLDGIQYKVDSADNHRYFDNTIKQWVGSMRYTPEQIGGAPVATRVRIPVRFVMYDEKFAKELSHQKAAAPECQAAASSDDMQKPVAVDSPFKKLEAG